MNPKPQAANGLFPPFWTALTCLFLASTSEIRAAAPTPENVPFPTGTHRQQVRRFYTVTDGLPANEIQAVTVTREGIALVAAGEGLVRLKNQAFTTETGPASVTALHAPAQGPSALAGASNGVWALQQDQWQLEPNSPSNVIAFATDPAGVPWALCPIGVWRREQSWKLVHTVEDDEMTQPRDLLPGASNSVLVASQSGLYGLVGKRRYWLQLEVRPGGLLSSTVRSLAWLDQDHFLVATDKGLNISNGSRGWVSIGAGQGLPILNLTHVTVAPDGTIWLGSDEGLIRWKNGTWSYLAGRRWLPNDKVTALATGPEGAIWVGTPAGLSHIHHRKLTLAEKADLLQQDLESRPRRHGYVTELRLQKPGTLEGALQEVSDNDGLWTALYIAAQSFRYAATKAPEAQAQAWRSMQALLRLETITGIAGFPARAICHKDEPQFNHRSIRSHPEWHESPVEKGWVWKGETSSDEIDGHYFGWHVFHELAADAEQKKAVAAVCKRVTDHILDRGYYLVDKDGQPTTWGFWGPDRLNDDPRYWEERALGSLEMLSHLKVAARIVGEPRYERAYRELIKQHHYALNTLPGKVADGVSHDDQLLFLAYYPLLQLEDDPGLRAIYSASLKDTWEPERIEGNPLWNFIYGACTGELCDVENSVTALREIPLDFIQWKMRNSHRADLKPAPARPLPWAERVIHKWDKNPYELDDGGDLGEGDQTIWLLPYWMGRYHRLID